MNSRVRLAMVAAAVLTTCWGAGGVAHADPITVFNFDGNTGRELSVAPTQQATGASSSDITRGAGMKVGAFSDSGSFAFRMVKNNFNNSQATQEANGEYVLFSVTADAGHTLSLSQMVFGVNMQSTPKDAEGNVLTPDHFPMLAVSTDGTNFVPVAATSTSGGGTNSYDNVNVGTFDLSGISGLQNMTGTVTFHLYESAVTSHGYQTGSIVGWDSLYKRRPSADHDAITLSGTVSAVPEPASLGLLGLGGLAMLRRRK